MYRFYFNFPTVNEGNRRDFLIHCSTCNCGHGISTHNGFWTDWFENYQDAHDTLERLIDKFRDHDFVIRPCNQCR